MTAEVTRRTTCRLCDGKNLELVVPFARIPVAGAFVTKDRLHEEQKGYPLDLYFCADCAHVQILDVVDPAIVFARYNYFSSASPGLVKHFSDYADSVLRRYRPPSGALVIDIGSNDGVFLKFFKEKGYRVLGIDPAGEAAQRARNAGIETLVEFFERGSAPRLREKYGPAAIVTANNVYAHANDMIGMTEGIRDLLAPDGLFVFEVSYVVDVVDKMLLGSVIHEHICYHSVIPLQKFFDRIGMELVDIERVTIQGGSLIGYVQRKGGPHRPSGEVARLVQEEKARGFDRPEVYRAFSERIQTLRRQVRDLLEELTSKGAKIAGFGAARGGTTMIGHFGLGDFLEYLVDDSPEKQGLYSPGLHLPVLPSEVIYDRKPDYLFLLAWVHAKPILERHRKFLEAGGHFIIAHPELRIV